MHIQRDPQLVSWDSLHSFQIFINCDENVNNEGVGYDFSIYQSHDSWIAGLAGKNNIKEVIYIELLTMWRDL